MEPNPDIQDEMQEYMPEEANEGVELGPGDERLAQLVERAQETKSAIIVKRDGQPVAAIVDFDQLVELEQLVDDLDAKAIGLEYEAADARGEVEYLTHEEFKEYMEKVVAETMKRATLKDGSRAEVAGE